MKLLNIFIDGEWRPSTGQEWIDDVNPASEEVLARVPKGTAEDVDAAMDSLEIKIADTNTPIEKMWLLERYTLQ